MLFCLRLSLKCWSEKLECLSNPSLPLPFSLIRFLLAAVGGAKRKIQLPPKLEEEEDTIWYADGVLWWWRGVASFPTSLPSIPPPPRLHSKFEASRVPSWRPYCGGGGRRTALAKEGASIPFPYLQTRRSSLTSPVLSMCLGKGETCEQRSGYAALVS